MKNKSEFFNFGYETLRKSHSERERAAQFDRKLWKELSATKIFDVAADDNVQSVVHAFRELGKGSLDIPFCVSAVAQWIAIDLLKRFGSTQQRERHLDSLSSGEKLAAVCNSESGAGTDIRAIVSEVVLDDSGYRAQINKRGATNLGDADIMLCSAWLKEQGQKPLLEVFIMEKEDGQQKSHIGLLSGFKTGMTGSFLGSKSSRPTEVDEIRLGRPKEGFSILKHCFNLERLLIGAVVAGVIEGILHECTTLLEGKMSMGRRLTEYQYMQQKLVDIYISMAKIDGLIDSILENSGGNLEIVLAKKSKLLSVLKMAIIQDGGLAFSAYFEMGGFPSYTLHDISQKLIRDHLALKFLGGSLEQQKIVLFNELFGELQTEKQIKMDLQKIINGTVTETAEGSNGKKPA